MTTAISPATTVREIVGQYPRTRPVFEQAGIDYCCGGGCSLEHAASEQGLALDGLLADLTTAIESLHDETKLGKDWAAATETELLDHILDTHHTFMKAQLPRLAGLFDKVQSAHGAKHGDVLASVRSVFDGFKAEIDEHLMKEEQILFPFIRELAAYEPGRGDKPVSHCGTVQNPIRQMYAEHDNAAQALEKMQELTADYTLPADACPTFAALYDGLQAIEADLHEHIHLENNILFPRAIALEEAI